MEFSQQTTITYVTDVLILSSIYMLCTLQFVTFKK